LLKFIPLTVSSASRMDEREERTVQGRIPRGGPTAPFVSFQDSAR